MLQIVITDLPVESVNGVNSRLFGGSTRIQKTRVDPLILVKRRRRNRSENNLLAAGSQENWCSCAFKKVKSGCGLVLLEFPDQRALGKQSTGQKTGVTSC